MDIVRDLFEPAVLVFNRFNVSALFVALRCLSISSNVIRTSPGGYVRGIISTIVLGFGGGLVTSLLTGQPWLLLYRNDAIPIYAISYIVLANTPVVRWIDSNQRIFSYLFMLVDAVNRGSNLPIFLMRFRDLQDGGRNGKDSITGQLVLGTLSITAGGLSYLWIFRNKPFVIPKWNFAVAFLTTAVAITIMDSMDEFPHYFGRLFRELLESNGITCDFSVSEIKFILALLILVGVLAAPKELPGLAVSLEKEPVVVSGLSDKSEMFATSKIRRKLINDSAIEH